jgi:hypothetical protein
MEEVGGKNGIMLECWNEREVNAEVEMVKISG